MSVGLRIGLSRHPDVELATLARWSARSPSRSSPPRRRRPSRGVHAGAAWPFLLAGLLQPGIGQLLVTLAIREAGASRASVVLGSAPLVSVTIALSSSASRCSVPLIVGAVLIVAGGVELARERGRPEHVRRSGSSRLRR